MKGASQHANNEAAVAVRSRCFQSLPLLESMPLTDQISLKLNSVIEHPPFFGATSSFEGPSLTALFSHWHWQPQLSAACNTEHFRASRFLICNDKLHLTRTVSQLAEVRDSDNRARQQGYSGKR